MHTVYLIQSIPYPNRRYIGLTTRLEERLSEHNRGSVDATKKNIPWSLTASISFPDESKARAFEAYLKTGSGRAWVKRHLQ
jgi:putative endonuclease